MILRGLQKGKNMGLFKWVRMGFGQIFDFRITRWVGLKNIKENANYFYTQGKSLFKLEKATTLENFNEAQDRLALTEADLELQKNRYRYLSFLFVILFFILIAYGIFLYLYKKNWMGIAMTFSLSLYALSIAFRYHFWYFQIKTKKLGCSIKEWFNFYKHERNV